MKKLKSAKVFSLLLAVVIIVSMAAGCGSKVQNNTAASNETTQLTTTNAETTQQTTTSAETTVEAKNMPGGVIDDTSPITFDWYVDDTITVKWGQDTTSQYITKKTGVSINFIIYGGAEKKNLMIASGDLPDFYSCGFWEPDIKKLIEGDMVLSINELAEKYDSGILDVIPNSVQQWFSKKYGKFYQLPNCNYPPEKLTPTSGAVSWQSLMVRKDMYEAIGKPDMTTPEGFLNALKAAKEKYPTVDNQPLIPIQLYQFTETGNVSFEDLLAFLAIPFETPDGQFMPAVARMMQPESVTWLKTFRKATELGLIPKEVFIANSDQVQANIKQGRCFSLVYARNTVAQTLSGDLYQKDPNSVYMSIDTPSNSKKDPPQLRTNGINGWMSTLITKKNKNPERAIKFLHYWLTEEGQKDFFLGDPEVTRETVDGKERLRPEIATMKDTDNEAFIKKYAARDTYWMLLDNPFTNQFLPEKLPFIKQDRGLVHWKDDKY